MPPMRPAALGGDGLTTPATPSETVMSAAVPHLSLAGAAKLVPAAPGVPYAIAVTSYGVSLHVRPVEAADRAELAALFARLSDRSRYQRYMGVKPRLSQADLDFLSIVDHRAHEALVAVDPTDGRIVGETRYVAWGREPGAAELAFVVDDVWQGQGIASLLGAEAVRRAASSGFARLTATTFADNVAARGVLRRLGFTTCSIGAGVVDLSLRFGDDGRR
jgi:RimJ/RimL family protein N-acetyltransferase